MSEDAKETQEVVRRERWLSTWNPANDPNRIDCVHAWEILSYCMSPWRMGREIYRTGQLAVCDQQWRDLKICLKVMNVRRKNMDKARRLLETSRPFQNPEEAHVWVFRKHPPAQFSKEDSDDIDEDEGEEAGFISRGTS